jgi:hypothetical protein
MFKEEKGLTLEESKKLIKKVYKKGGEVLVIEGTYHNEVYIGTEIIPENSTPELVVSILDDLSKKKANTFNITYWI